jgi:hypothetical protein
VSPALCGSLDNATVDLASRELLVHETGYYSHWFSEGELLELAYEAGVQDVAVTADGIGLYLVGRGG